MKKLFAKELKIKFIEALNELDEFSYENGNPFLIRIRSLQYFIFLKNISSAYFKNTDITRVQLPYSKHFTKILKANIPFIVLGYNVEKDVVVSWNPTNVKDRLNAKSNVSLYSRSSLQEDIKDDEFRIGYLSNGEKIVLFKRDYLIKFFEDINELFNESKISETSSKTEPVNESAIEFVAKKISEITDNNLLSQIRPLLKKNQVLQAVEITSKHYAKKYADMTFKDWYKLVNTIYKQINS